MTIAMNRGQAPGVRMPLALIAIGLLAILSVLVYGIVSSVTDDDSPRHSYSPPAAVESDTGAVLTWAEDLSRTGVTVSGLSPASVSFDGDPSVPIIQTSGPSDTLPVWHDAYMAALAARDSGGPADTLPVWHDAYMAAVADRDSGGPGFATPPSGPR